MASKSTSQGPGVVPWVVIVPWFMPSSIWRHMPAVRTAETKSCCTSASTARSLSGRIVDKPPREQKGT